MTPQEFLDEFGTLAESAEGVPKLREMVLDLAVRGTLVPQDSSDEPASVLLERVATERARLVKEKKLRKRTLPTCPSGDEIPHQLPAGWEWTRLSIIGEIGPRNDVDDALEVSFLPMATIDDGYSGVISPEVRPWGEIKKGFTHVADGDVAMAKITPCFQNRKSAVMRGLVNGVGAGTTELHVVRPIADAIVPEYALLQLKSLTYLEVGVTKMTGSAGQKRVPKDYFADTPFPLPPLAEQHRIVSKVDELMGLCDRLEEVQGERRGVRVRLNRSSLDRLTSVSGVGARQRGSELSAAWQRVCDHFEVLYDTPETLPDLRQTILQLAVQGKLVPQDPNDEPAGDAIAAIADEKERLFKAKDIKKPKPIAPITDDERNGLPITWEAARLAGLVNPRFTITYGVLVPGPDIPDGVPFVRINDLDTDNPPELPAKSISPEVDAKYERTRLVGGEILLGVVGSIGKLGVAPDSWAGANIARAVCRIMAADQVDRDFLLLMLRSPLIQEYFLSTTRTLAQPTLNVGLIEAAVVPVPPLSEQKRIVSQVTHLLSQITRLESTLTRRESTRTQLLTSAIHSILGDE